MPKSREQKIQEVEDALDGQVIQNCRGGISSRLVGRHNESSEILFMGNFTKDLFRPCKNHLQWYREHTDIYTEIIQ